MHTNSIEKLAASSPSVSNNPLMEQEKQLKRKRQRRPQQRDLCKTFAALATLQDNQLKSNYRKASAAALVSNYEIVKRLLHHLMKLA